MAESSSDVYEIYDIQRIFDEILKEDSCSCGCCDPTKISRIEIDHGELVLKYCSNCNTTFGLDDSFDYEELRVRLEKLGLVHITLSPCNNCGNSDINGFTYEGADETGKPVLLCRKCKNLSVFQQNNNFENGLDSENINSKIKQENLEEYQKSDVESFSYLYCENCGNDNPDLWSQVFCDIDDAVVCCLSCDKHYIIKQNWFIAKDSKEPSRSKNLGVQNSDFESKPKENGRTRVSNLSALEPGDHVEWHRKYGAYHHAIVEKIDISSSHFTVIEYSGSLHKIDGHYASVRKTTLLFKPTDDMMFRINYERGFCLTNKETLAKAKSRLGEAKYNPVTNNCEHFATWCKTEKSQSGQMSVVANRLARVAAGTGLKTGEEIIQAGALSVKNIPWKDSFKIARHIGLRNAKTYGKGVTKLARNIKGGAIVLNFGVSVAIESAFTAYHMRQAYRLFTEGKISKEDYERQCRKLGWETLGGLTTGTISGFAGQAIIPIPIVGAVVGTTLGNIIGRHLGALLGKSISEKQWKNN